MAASEARARSRGASPRGGRHQHHIHVHGPINASVNVGQPSKQNSNNKVCLMDATRVKSITPETLRLRLMKFASLHNRYVGAAKPSKVNATKGKCKN